MNQFIESLKRLFEVEKVSEEKINNLYKKGTINEIDRNYILGKERS